MLTYISAIPWIFSTVAIIEVDPFDFVVTLPFWTTIATNSFVEDQTTSGSSISLLFLSIPPKINTIFPSILSRAANVADKFVALESL